MANCYAIGGMEHVIPQGDHYLVVVKAWTHVKLYRVERDKTCSCGIKHCEHVDAVRQYLKGGGSREPQQPDYSSYSEYLRARTKEPDVVIGTCPVCGARTESTAYGWRCSTSTAHFWLHEGERRGVRDFLTKPHSNKEGAFYESIDEGPVSPPGTPKEQG